MDKLREDLGAPALSQLVKLFKPVFSRRAGLALGLWGEAGIGKTHKARSLLTLSTCRTFGVHATAPLAELMRGLPQPSHLPRWAKGPLEALMRGEQLATAVTADVLAAWLAALTPMILHLEDLHEVLPECLELWQELAQRAKRTRGAALLVTSRNLPPEPFEPYRLEPLSVDASQMLLERELRSALPPEATAWIYERAAGNPLFTLEYLRYLMRQGYLWNDRERWHWREPPKRFLPTTVEALLERSIEQSNLSEIGRAMLDTAAFLPLDAPEGLWLKIAELPEDLIEPAKVELERHGLFKDGRFTHPLFREVILRNLTLLRRRELAKRALSALSDDALAAVAFIENAELAPEVALTLLKAAAERSRALGDDKQAGRLLSQALDYARGPEQSELALEAARLLRGRDEQEALRLAQCAIEINGTDEAVYLLAELLAGQHRLEEAELALEQLSDMGKQRGEWPLRLARVYASGANFKKLLELVEAQPELANADPFVSYMTSYSYLYINRLHEAEQLAQRTMVKPLEDHERARFLGIFEAVALERGEPGKALSFSEERISLYRKSQQLSSLASALEKRAQLLEVLSDHTAQLAHLQEALELFAEVRSFRRMTGTQADLGYALIQYGRYEEAEEVLLQARDLLSRLEVSDNHLLIEAFLTLLYYEWRPPHAIPLALRHARAVTQVEGPWLWPIMKAGTHWTAALVEAWQGNPARALSLALVGIETAEALQHHNIHAANLYAQGLAQERLGQDADAVRSLEQAVTLFRQAGFKERAERVALELDRLNRNPEKARERLEWFETRGLKNGANIARRYFPELAEREAAPIQVTGSLRLEVLGPMRLVRDGAALPVRGRKRKELLAYLLEARLVGLAEVPQLELCDLLYPQETDASASLKQLVFSTRKTLGADVILRTSGGYVLGQVSSDAEEFLAQGDTSLWRGNYLEDLGSSWNDTVQQELHDALLARLREALEGEPKEGVRLARLLVQAEPYNLEVLKLAVLALQASGSRQGLEKLYQAARERLAEVGEALPESWRGFLEARSPEKPA